MQECKDSCLRSDRDGFVGVEFDEEAFYKTCNCLYELGKLPHCAPMPLEMFGISDPPQNNIFTLPNYYVGEFGLADFRIEMDVRGRGLPIASGFAGGFLFARQYKTANGHTLGPSLEVLKGSTAMKFYVNSAQKFEISDFYFPSPHSKRTRHIVFTRQSSRLSVEINGEEKGYGIMSHSPELTLLENEPLRFQFTNEAEPVPLIMDVFNVKISFPEAPSAFTQPFDLPVLRTCKSVDMDSCGRVAAQGQIAGVSPYEKECGGRRRLTEANLNFPQTDNSGNFILVGAGKCRDNLGRHFSNIMNVFVAENDPSLPLVVDRCSETCLESDVDQILGLSVTGNTAETGANNYCFCYISPDTVLPELGSETSFASYSAGEGPVYDSDGRDEHACYKYAPPVPTASPSSSPTQYPSLAPSSEVFYFSDNIFSFMGIGHCVNGKGFDIIKPVTLVFPPRRQSSDGCSGFCIELMEPGFVGFDYHHTTNECRCLYSEEMISGSVVDGDGDSDAVCFMFVGNTPTQSPSTSSPTLMPTQSSYPTTSPPTLFNRTTSDYFHPVGDGRCLDEAGQEYTRGLIFKPFDKSAGDCEGICRAHSEEGGDFVIGFEVVPGSSCECLVSWSPPTLSPTAAPSAAPSSSPTATYYFEDKILAQLAIGIYIKCGKEAPACNQAKLEYGYPIGNWNTERMTDMSNLFAGFNDFNEPLTNWDTRKVTNFGGMFEFAKSFNQPLASFDTSGATNMQDMFKFADAFNQPLDHFDTAKVKRMDYMFSQNSIFVSFFEYIIMRVHWTNSKFFLTTPAQNQDISMWNLTLVESQKRMFYENKAIDRCFEEWGKYYSSDGNYDQMFEGAIGCDSQSSPDSSGGPWCSCGTRRMQSRDSSRQPIKTKPTLRSRSLLAGSLWSSIGQPGDGSSFPIMYADSHNAFYAGRCVTYDYYGDLKINTNCNGNSDQEYIYTSDKKLQVQGGAKAQQCMWADRGTYPKFLNCDNQNKVSEMTWVQDEDGRLTTLGGLKCLVTYVRVCWPCRIYVLFSNVSAFDMQQGTREDHSDTVEQSNSLTMRDCSTVVINDPTSPPTVAPSPSPCFTSKAELQQAIDDYINCGDDTDCKASLGYGYPIGNWCTGQVTDMAEIFRYKSTFNEPLTNWDTSKVTSMM